MKEEKNILKTEYKYMGMTFIIALILAFYYLKVWYFPWEKPETIVGFNNGDTLLYSMAYKNMINSGSLWRGQQLGAPFNFTLYDFPNMANLVVNIPIFLFGKIFNNTITSMFIVIVLAFPMTATFSYYAIRQFKVKYSIAMIGAITYAFIPFKFMRMWQHVSLGNSLMVIPISVVLLYWLYEDKELLVWKSDILKYKRNILAMIFIIIIGVGDTYYTYFFCFFVVVVTLINLLDSKEWRLTIKKSLTIIFVAIFSMIMNLLPSILNSMSGLATAEPPIRGPNEAEIYGLKLTHLLMPSNTGVNFLDSLFNGYVTTTSNNNENTSAFLGIFGVLGFIILLVVLFSNHVFKEREEQIKFLSRLNIAAFLLASMGGFSYLVSRFIYSQIRGYNRISVFIAFFGVLAFCIVISMLLENINKSIYKRIITVCLIVMGLISTVFNGETKASITTGNIYKYTENNNYIYDFIKKVEAQVSENAMIYEMPYYKFPESPPQNNMGDYVLSIPYMYSNNNLRWSYGSYKGTNGDLWHRAIANLPIEQRIMRLSYAGFEGIYIDSTAYKQNELQELLTKLDDILGCTPIISSNNNMYFYSMKKYNESLNLNSDEVKNKIAEPFFLEGAGMYGIEHDKDEKWIWNDKKSKVYAFNDLKEPVKKALTMKINTSYTKDSDINIECNEEKYNFKVNNKGTVCEMILTLKPGINEIKFNTNASKVNASLDTRNLYFRITDFDLLTN